MKKYILLLFIIFSCKANLLQQPERLTDQQIQELAYNWNTQLTWKLADFAECTFIYENKSAGFAIKLLKIPFYFYKYRAFPTIEEVKQYFASQNYLFTDPLVLDSSTPLEASLDTVINILRTKKVIFYTSAGISASSNVATMNDLGIL